MAARAPELRNSLIYHIDHGIPKNPISAYPKIRPLPGACAEVCFNNHLAGEEIMLRFVEAKAFSYKINVSEKYIIK